MNDWLTDSELLVMKTVWESKEPLSVQEIMLRTNQKYDKTVHCVECPQIYDNGRLDYWPDGFFDEWEKALDEII